MMKTFRLTLFSFFVMSSCAFAQSQESKIQALFVLKFVENVSWPQDRKDIVIGVVGKSDILTELQNRLAAKNPNGIVVKKISASEASTCNAVFVPSSEDKSMSTVISASSKAVLVITESDFSDKGSSISFFEEAGKLRFAINKSNLEAKGLKVSGSLLTLAKQV